MDDHSRSLVPPLPETAKGLLEQRLSPLKRTLNDVVEEALVGLWENEKFRKFCEAVRDAEAVEGSLSADNVMAATMVRDYGKNKGNMVLAGQKLAPIVQAIGVVLRRYQVSRKQRANMVGGVIVPSENNQNNND